MLKNEKILTPAGKAALIALVAKLALSREEWASRFYCVKGRRGRTVDILGSTLHRLFAQGFIEGKDFAELGQGCDMRYRDTALGLAAIEHEAKLVKKLARDV